MNDPNGITTGVSTFISNNLRRISFIALPGVNEVEFVNFIFNPGLLKVCKVADDAGTLGRTFNFTATTGTDSPLLPDTSTTFSIIAGPRATGDVAQNGFCVFINGPFTSTGTTGGGGFFNLGASVTVTETVPAGFRLISVTSPTAGTGGFSTTGTSGTLSGATGVVRGTSEIVFTNGVATIATPTPTPTPTPTIPTPTVTPTPTPTVAPTLSQTPTPILPPLKPRRRNSGKLTSMGF